MCMCWILTLLLCASGQRCKRSLFGQPENWWESYNSDNLQQRPWLGFSKPSRHWYERQTNQLQTCKWLFLVYPPSKVCRNYLHVRMCHVIPAARGLCAEFTSQTSRQMDLHCMRLLVQPSCRVSSQGFLLHCILYLRSLWRRGYISCVPTTQHSSE